VGRLEVEKDLVVLLSGGLDSATALALYKDRAALALGVDYGQPHAIELEYAERIAEHSDVPYVQLPSAIACTQQEVVFAGRNALLLTMGCCEALRVRAKGVVIGCNFGDWELFPDCRPEFISHLSHALAYAYGVSIFAPFLRMSKAEVVARARELGVPIEQTWSCYEPALGGEPCGECLACETRAKALAA
jgi:7-cyano-7-deazaguanine synthase